MSMLPPPPPPSDSSSHRIPSFVSQTSEPSIQASSTAVDTELSIGQKALLITLVFTVFSGACFYLANWNVQPAQGAKPSAQLAMEPPPPPPPKPTVWSYTPTGLKRHATGLGTPKINVRWRIAQLAYQAHLDHKPTPYNMGSYGCAAAAWTYAIRPALLAAYPDAASKIPVTITHTQQIRSFYQRYHLGNMYSVPVFDLTPDKTPPGSVIIGVKQGSGDEHMLVAVEVDWGGAKNPATGEVVPAGLDGVTDAYAGNTGLPKFGSPHFRIQEFASSLGFLNTHHGAINSLDPNNYYDHFIVFTFDR